LTRREWVIVDTAPERKRPAGDLLEVTGKKGENREEGKVKDFVISPVYPWVTKGHGGRFRGKQGLGKERADAPATDPKRKRGEKTKVGTITWVKAEKGKN